jgi:UDP-N-acetylmuramyl pentapeptide phosphotransferase/UDP-N-acetylglucosamine-1-phosphate transferase
MFILAILCAAISTVACAFLLRWGRSGARLYGLDMPQRFHAGHVPRLGGAAMLLATIAGWIWMVVAEPLLSVPTGFALVPAAAFGWAAVAILGSGAGLAEDLTHTLSPRWRLGATLLAGIAAVWLLDARIGRLDVPAIDQILARPWLAAALTVVAIAGLPHAFNLIDGYNGLASSIAIICCLALAYVAMQVGDRHLAAVAVSLASATAGFLLWNYPRGLLFAGDGGAYLWGAVIALISILLVQRHPQVSAWFPMLLLSYPVLETAFSIYRKLVRGQSPGMADALHLHQLVYRRIVREVFEGDDEARRMLMRNNRTSPYLWGFAMLTVVPAVLFWRNTYVLMAFCCGFVVLYVWAYTSIVRFRVPRWIRRGP